MRAGTALRRFLVPRAWISLRAYLRFHCRVSPRAEVEITANLTIGAGSSIGSFTKVKSADGPLTKPLSILGPAERPLETDRSHRPRPDFAIAVGLQLFGGERVPFNRGTCGLARRLWIVQNAGNRGQRVVGRVALSHDQASG